MRLQVADHGGAPPEEAQTHFTLVGFLPGVDTEVVGELPRVSETFPAVATPVPLPTHPCRSDTAVLTGASVRQDSRGYAVHRPLKKLVRHADAHSQTQTEVAHFNEPADVP